MKYYSFFNCLLLIGFGLLFSYPVSHAKPSKKISAKHYSSSTLSQNTIESSLPSSAHSRIQRIDTSQDSVITLVLSKGMPTVIEVPEEEKILDIAVGGLSDWSEEWELVKREKSFFIKPLHKANFTTLIVSTNQHHYIFDLQVRNSLEQKSSVASTNSRIILERNFTAIKVDEALQFDKERDHQKKIEIAQQKIISVEKKIQQLRHQNFLSRSKNTNYSLEIVQMKEDIQPRHVFDDGRFTYFQFPNRLAIPTIYRKAHSSDQETLINYHMEDDFLVAHATGASWVLRLGQSVVAIYNDQYEAEGLTSQLSEFLFAKRSIK